MATGVTGRTIRERIILFNCEEDAFGINTMEADVNSGRQAIDTAEVLNSAPDDYINPSDGLKYCAKCHTPKEAFYPADLQNQGFHKHPVMCQCAAEKRDREEAERRDFERMTRITTLRSEAFRDIPAAGWQFDHAVVTPQLAKAKEYAANWDSFKQDGIGLLLFGDVGTGKSYAAGCIANALIDRMESVLFVGMADVVNRMQGNFGADRDRYILRKKRLNTAISVLTKSTVCSDLQTAPSSCLSGQRSW